MKFVTAAQEREAVLRLLEKMEEVAQFCGDSKSESLFHNAARLIAGGEHHNNTVYEEFDEQMARGKKDPSLLQ